MTEDDIAPENFVEFSAVDMDGSTKAGEVGSSGFIKIKVDKDTTGDEQIRAWFEKIYEKMKSLSADGKVHDNFMVIGTDKDEEFSLENLFNGPLWEKYPGASWAYPYEGNFKLSVSTSYDYDSGEYKMGITVYGN